jgi:hypothetical protein
LGIPCPIVNIPIPTLIRPTETFEIFWEEGAIRARRKFIFFLCSYFLCKNNKVPGKHAIFFYKRVVLVDKKFLKMIFKLIVQRRMI